MRQNEILRVERSNNTWLITDPDDPRAGKVSVDAAVVAVTTQGKGWVQGYVLAVHGLDFEAAKDFRQGALNALGVASQVKGFAPPPNALRNRYQLTQDGEIKRDRQ